MARDPSHRHREALERLALEASATLELPRVLRTLSQGLVERYDAAFARIWLLRPGDLCSSCHVADDCPDRERCLHLVASAGVHTRLDGQHRRVPLGAFKIGKIAQGWGPTSTADVERDDRITDKEWVRRHQFRSFAGYPLISRERLLGVIAIFSRRELDLGEFNRLALFAHQSAITIKNAMRHGEATRLLERLRRDNEILREESRLEYDFEQIVGRNPVLRRAVSRIHEIGPAPGAVLILGEQGTGRELLARAIHGAGPNGDRALVRVQGSDFSPDAAETARGSTLFLAEIGTSPAATQERIVRALSRCRDVRVIASSTLDPAREADVERFHPELALWFEAHRVELPPLRERRGDIPLLVSLFVHRAAARSGRRFDGVTQDSLRRLMNYAWPGNVRELRNVIERAVDLSRGPKVVVDPALDADPSAELGPPSSLRLRDVERQHIVEVLKRTGGVIEGKRGAAALLGLPPSTLRSRMTRLGIRVGRTVRRT